MTWDTVPLGALIAPAPPQRLGASTPPILLSMTMRDGLVEQTSKFKKRIAGADLTQYRIALRGQLVVGFPIDEAVLAFQRAFDAGIVSPAYGLWNIRDRTLVDDRYLERYLRSDLAVAFYRAKLRGTTARRRSLPREVFEAMPIPLPPLPEQRRIAAILDEVDALQSTALSLTVASASLAESAFRQLEMTLSDRHVVPLSEIATVGSGITKGRAAPLAGLLEVPYMTVANVQDKRLDLSNVKTIEASEAEIERYRLLANDLLLTEGGDPDKLGRGVVWNSELSVSIHQNHVFRVRAIDASVDMTWLSWEIGSDYGKRYFLRAAKQTTGIATINSSQLRGFPVRVPPKAAIATFRERLDQAEALKATSARRVAGFATLFTSLQHRAFRGEL